DPDGGRAPGPGADDPAGGGPRHARVPVHPGRGPGARGGRHEQAARGGCRGTGPGHRGALRSGGLLRGFSADGAARGAGGGDGHQAAARLHATAGGRHRAARLPAVVRVHGDPGAQLQHRAPASPARAAVTARGLEGPTAERAVGRAQLPIQAVLFDLDDTLLDTASAFGAAVAAIATEFLPDLPAERHPEVVATWRLDRGGHYQAHVEGRIDYFTQRLARAQEIQTVFGGQPLDADGFTRWGRVWDEAFAGAWCVFDDTAAALERLRGLGLPVGCVTNADRAQQARKLAATGLTDHLPLLVTLDTFGVGKPDPRVFHEGARLLEVDPARVLYIG